MKNFLLTSNFEPNQDSDIKIEIKFYPTKIKFMV